MGITRYSKKRAAQVRQYSKESTQYLKDHPLCEVKAVTDCQYFSDQIEHTEGREGERLLDTAKFKASCAMCSRWVTDHPAAALAMGITRSRLSK